MCQFHPISLLKLKGLEREMVSETSMVWEAKTIGASEINRKGVPVRTLLLMISAEQGCHFQETKSGSIS